MIILLHLVNIFKKGDFWIILGLLLFTLINNFTLVHDIGRSNYTANFYIYSWLAIWNCHTLETMNFSNYWASNAMYPSPDAFALSEHYMGLVPFACPVWWISRNPVLTINIVALLLLWGTSISTYLIIKKIVGSGYSAFAGTIIFAFYPWIQRAMVTGKVHMVACLWLPLILYANYRYWLANKKKYLFILGAAWFWTFLISMYTGIFTAIFLVLWNIIWFIYEKKLITIKKAAWWIFTTAIVWVFMIPIFYEYYRTASEYGVIRDLEQQVRMTGNVWSWFTAAPENWLWAQKFGIIPVSTPTEMEDMMFPGIMSLIFLIISFFIKRMPGWLKSLRWAGIIIGIFAMGTYAKGIPWKIPLPFLALWYLFPPMRAIRNPHRLCPFAILAISFIAAFLLAQMPAKRIRFAIIKIIIISAICLEVVNYAIPKVTIDSSTTAFYKSLYNPEKLLTIIEFPAGIVIEQPAYLIASTYHWNRIINGITGMWPPVQHQLASELLDFPSGHAIRLLQSLDADTIIIHENKYESHQLQKLLQRMQSRNEIKFIKRDSSLSLWSLAKGESRAVLQPESDLQIRGPSKLVEGKVTLALEVTPGCQHVVFNPKAPIRFTFPGSRPWQIQSCLKGDHNENCSENDWHSPGLFHPRMCSNHINAVASPGNNELSMNITMADKQIVLKKEIAVVPAQNSYISLPSYVQLPARYQPIPLEKLTVEFKGKFPDSTAIQPGDDLEGVIDIANPGPYYWYAKNMNGIHIGAKLVCDNFKSFSEFALPHDLFPGDKISQHIYISLPVNFKNCHLYLNCFGKTKANPRSWFPESNETEIWHSN